MRHRPIMSIAREGRELTEEEVEQKALDEAAAAEAAEAAAAAAAAAEAEANFAGTSPLNTLANINSCVQLFICESLKCI